MAVIVKVAAAALPGPKWLSCAFAIGLGCVCAGSDADRLRNTQPDGLFLRGAYGEPPSSANFLAIEHLPVGVATLLNYTAPVFTALYAAASFSAKGCGARRWAHSFSTSTGVVWSIKRTGGPGSPQASHLGAGGSGNALLSGAAVATIREVRRTNGSWGSSRRSVRSALSFTGVPTLANWKTPRRASGSRSCGRPAFRRGRSYDDLCAALRGARRGGVVAQLTR